MKVIINFYEGLEKESTEEGYEQKTVEITGRDLEIFLEEIKSNKRLHIEDQIPPREYQYNDHYFVVDNQIELVMDFTKISK